jgi:hypothetical protein
MADPNSTLWPSATVADSGHSGVNGAGTSYTPTLATPTTAAQTQDSPYSTFTSPTAAKPTL